MTNTINNINPQFFLKVLASGRMPPLQGRAPWPSIGRWTERRQPKICSSGWHVTDILHLPRWFEPSNDVYLCEVAGRHTGRKEVDKMAWEYARLVRKLPSGDKFRISFAHKLELEIKKHKDGRNWLKFNTAPRAYLSTQFRLVFKDFKYTKWEKEVRLAMIKWLESKWRIKIDMTASRKKGTVPFNLAAKR